LRADRLIIRRRLERGVETVSSPLPLVVTVNGTATFTAVTGMHAS